MKIPETTTMAALFEATLGDRTNPLCVLSPKVGKACAAILAVSGVFVRILAVNFFNVNAD